VQSAVSAGLSIKQAHVISQYSCKSLLCSTLTQLLLWLHFVAAVADPFTTGGWDNIHALMNYDDKAVHEKLLNDRLATSFFTALVMTVAFAALLISPVSCTYYTHIVIHYSVQ
jgi:hypothetical protein